MPNNIAAIAPIAILVAGAVLLFLGASFSSGSRVWGIPCLATLAASAWALDVTGGAASGEEAGWPEIDRNLASDTLAGVALALGFVWALAAYGRDRNRPAAAESFGCLLLCVTGLVVLAAADDLILLVLAFELVRLPVWLLVVLDGAGRESGRFRISDAGSDPGGTPLGSDTGAADVQAGEERGRRMQDGRSSKEMPAKLYLQGLLAFALLAYGASLLYGLSGTTELAEIRGVLGSGFSPVEPASTVTGRFQLLLPAALFILAGLGLSMGIVPFHFGGPDYGSGGSAWHGGLLALFPKAAAFVVIARLFGDVTAGIDASLPLLLGVAAAATMLTGSAMALREPTVRRLLAYTTTAHAGFVLMGIAAASASGRPASLPSVGRGWSLPGGQEAAMFAMLAYLAAGGGLFAVMTYLRPSDCLAGSGGTRLLYVEELYGLVSRQPAAAGCAVVCLLSLAGLPPLPGFLGAIMLLSSSLAVPVQADAPLPLLHPGFVMLVVVAAVGWVLLAITYLRLVAAVVLRAPVARWPAGGGRWPLAAALALASATLLLGLLPGPILSRLDAMLRAW